jgi:galactokinase
MMKMKIFSTPGFVNITGKYVSFCYFSMFVFNISFCWCKNPFIPFLGS